MKHILNDISKEEKNRILEQHSGGKTIDTTKFKRLLESTLGNVKPLISEQDDVTTQTTTVVAPTTQTTTAAPKSETHDGWVKVIAFSDPEATKSMTNIEIDPHMIGLTGNDVKFMYRVAGKNVNGTGTFDCNSKNDMHFDGKPLMGTMYISDKRVDLLRSKCGTNQGYASTNTGSNNNMA